MDADGQNDPRDFPSLWKAACDLPADAPPTVLCGRRTRRADTWVKFLSSRIANGVRRSLLHDETPDTGWRHQALPAPRVARAAPIPQYAPLFPLPFPAPGRPDPVLAVGDRLRQGGTSKFGLRNRLFTGIVDMLGVLWLVRRKTGPFTSLRNLPEPGHE